MQPDIRVDADCLAGKFLEATWLLNGFEERQEARDSHGILLGLYATEHGLVFTIHCRSRALSWTSGKVNRRKSGCWHIETRMSEKSGA